MQPAFSLGWMDISMSLKHLGSATLIGLACTAASAAETAATSSATTLTVTEERLGDPLVSTASVPAGSSTADAGATLRDQPGMSGVRMGGLGIDPVLRGQSASRIEIITDGANPHGGCPNRMDPPTAYAPAGADVVTVEPGGTTVHRAGVAGTVSLDRTTPRFSADERARATADARYGSNGQAREAGADVTVGVPTTFARGTFHAAKANDYQDGDGNVVRSSYRTTKGGGTVGWTPSDVTRLEASVDAVAERDVAFAGAGMDAPTSDGLTARLRFRTENLGPVSRLSADVYHSGVDHDMDNYSLRPLTGMAMRAPSTSDTTGGRIDTVSRHGAWDSGLGVDGEDLRQDARRYTGMNPSNVSTLQSVLWPDARITRIGVYGDATWHATADTDVTTGVRGDQVRSDAAAANEDPAGVAMSPNALYQTYYGTTAAARSEYLVGGVLRSDYHWSERATLGVAVSRLCRAADPTERFIAANGTAASRWVGNPTLAAESHHQAQAIAVWRERNTGHVRGEAWVDRVHNFIRRDRARGQDGVLVSDRATIYHNTEALLAGCGLAGAVDARDWLELGADAAWTWATDLDSGTPLAQIPPLAGRSFVRAHHGEQVETTLTLRWSARQNRVDDDVNTGSAVDDGATAGWGVIDWSAGWKPCANGSLRVGIDNVFNRTYAEHLNKPSAFDPTVERVNEPGRSYWVGGQVVF
jgi:iron complex outermembrane receptor protein